MGWGLREPLASSLRGELETPHFTWDTSAVWQGRDVGGGTRCIGTEQLRGGGIAFCVAPGYLEVQQPYAI